MSFAKGERIRVLRDNGRDGIVGFEGTVDGVVQSGVIVILDSDPARRHRMYMPTGFVRAHRHVAIRRFFYPGEIEKL